MVCNAQTGTQIDFKQMKIYGGSGQGLMMWQGTVHDTLKSPGDSLIPITYSGNTQIGWIKASSLGGSGGGGSGSVTSVGLALPAEFTISGSPVTTTGTLTGSWASQSAFTVFGRASGSGTPSFLSMDTTFISSFHTKVKSLFSATAPVSFSSTTGIISISQATTSTDGYLNSTDWNIFNSKQAALTTGNLTANAPASFSATRQVIGGAAVLTLDTSGAQGVGTVYGLGLKLSIASAAATYTPLSRTISTTSPLTGGGDLSADRTLAISNAAADGSTKGAASFTANDFDATTGNISLDYTNGQAASGSVKGFLIAADWTTFNSKQATISVTSPITLTGASVGIVNQGTTVQVLHGNAAGNASFSAVSLTADVSGILPGANGGTGVNNGSSTITLGGNLVTSGAFATTFTSTATTGVTLPTTGTLATLAGTETLTNKRITKRTGTVASSATPTINTDNVDFYSITALAAAITSFTTNLSGSPTEAQTLWIAITDNGTARAITWGASFEASGTVALPTTTVISTRLDVGFVWNTVTSKWRVVATS